MKKQSLLKGTIILGLAGVIAKFLGLFFRWPLIMLIGDEGIGYYQMSYPLYMFFLGIAAGGPVAISKMVSERNAVNDRQGAYDVLKTSILFMFLLGGGGTAILFLFSKPIVSFLKWNPKAYYSILAISIAPVIISVMSCFRGFFQGMQNMTPTAISQVIEQIGRVIVGVGLAYLLLPKGIEYSAGGAALGAAAGGLFAGVYLIKKYYGEKKQERIKSKARSIIMGRLIQTAIPISLGATVGTIMSLIDSALVPQMLLKSGLDVNKATILYGQLSGKAGIFINVPLTLSIALGASLVPIIAEAFILNNRNELNEKIELSFKLSSVIALPCMAGLFFMSYPIMNMLFPGRSDGYEILKYLSLSIPFIIYAQTTTSILQGTAYYYRPVLNLFIGCIVKVILTLALVPIPVINIYGAVIASIAAYVVSALLNMVAMKKRLDVKINLYDWLIKPAFASIIMIFGVLFVFTELKKINFGISIACITSIFIGMIIYIILIIIFRVFSYNYIKNRFSRR